MGTAISLADLALWNSAFVTESTVVLRPLCFGCEGDVNHQYRKVGIYYKNVKRDLTLFFHV